MTGLDLPAVLAVLDRLNVGEGVREENRTWHHGEIAAAILALAPQPTPALDSAAVRKLVEGAWLNTRAGEEKLIADILALVPQPTPVLDRDELTAVSDALIEQGLTDECGFDTLWRDRVSAQVLTFLSVARPQPQLTATRQPAPVDWSQDDRDDVERALQAAESGEAGHWPTVAGWLAAEVRRLRAEPSEDRRECIAPHRNHGDGRGCQVDGCPRHSEDGPDEPQLTATREKLVEALCSAKVGLSLRERQSATDALLASGVVQEPEPVSVAISDLCLSRLTEAMRRDGCSPQFIERNAGPWVAEMLAGERFQSPAEVRAPYIAFLDWLIRMDSPEWPGPEDRGVVTLTEIIRRAAAIRAGETNG